MLVFYLITFCMMFNYQGFLWYILVPFSVTSVDLWPLFSQFIHNASHLVALFSFCPSHHTITIIFNFIYTWLQCAKTLSHFLKPKLQSTELHSMITYEEHPTNTKMAIILDIVHHFMFLSNTVFQKIDPFTSSGLRGQRILLSWAH